MMGASAIRQAQDGAAQQTKLAPAMPAPVVAPGNGMGIAAIALARVLLAMRREDLRDGRAAACQQPCAAASLGKLKE